MQYLVNRRVLDIQIKRSLAVMKSKTSFIRVYAKT